MDPTRFASFPLDHVAFAVHSLREATAMYERIFGGPSSPVEQLPGQGVDVAFIGSVELLQPRGPESPVARFLERRGPGLHHIAFRVPDIRAELGRLADEGFEAIDPEPRPGARGHIVAFLHPRSTGGVLIELVQG